MSIQVLQRLARALQLHTLRQQVLAGGIADGGTGLSAPRLPAPSPSSACRAVNGAAEPPLRKRRPRFFTALAMLGRLHLVDIEEGGPWDPMRIRFDNPTMADSLRRRLGARRVRSIGELDLFLQESAVRTGIIILCVSAELLEAARIRWAYGDSAAATAAGERAPLVG